MARQSIETSFLAGANGAFIEELYGRYLKDPATVDPSWRSFFADLEDEAPSVLKALAGASWAPRSAHIIANGNGAANGAHAAAPAPAPAQATAPAGAAVADVQRAVTDSIRALMLIRSYRVRGHLHADLDPLGIDPIEPHAELDPATYGFAEADMDRPIYISGVLGFEQATLRQIYTRLRETYCGAIGVEYMHIQDPDEKAWIQERIESVHNRTEFTERGKHAILERLTQAETFEKFLHVKYPGTKRFGLDGGEALIPALEQIIKRGSQLGVEEAVIGMPHRGRLNVLANFMSKPFAQIFTEFQGADVNDVQGSGDVKYHLGTSADREFDDKIVHLSLNANPSHLEAVNPVVVGRIRAKQRQMKDKERRKVLGILMHGDAAFSGQGLVAETLGLSDIKGYRTGGTIHVVVNNQIGFTTNPQWTRASRYPTEVAKMIQAPIFHVNGDDVEAVVHVARIATEFRQHFRKDVVMDIWCYRRFGHNESDEPSFTQPLMYKAIAKHPTTCEIYARKLIDEGVIDESGARALVDETRARLNHDFAAAGTYKTNKTDWFEGVWSGFNVAPSPEERRGKTDVSIDFLREVGRAITTIPDQLKVNAKVARIVEARRKAVETGEGFDWATAEALAFGTLVAEGTFVRLSGQDCGRGTFSQRHAVLVDQDTERRYVPCANVRADQARFIVLDSPLAEASVLGFEYGYSLAEPNALIIWEAQFGDFANGAQVLFDQFISSAESKWHRMSGLVMLLPHGYEGQGPEHSSARLERFLQLSGEDNWQVANITTPANYFHALRRQVRRNFRKPLVIMAPKSLLRHKHCVSRIEDMGPDTCFHRVLGDQSLSVADDKVRRVVLCSGKVYFDLLAEREARGIGDIALVRIEQLFPFPIRSLGAELGRYSRADVVWCQEEARNMGAWTFVDRRIEELLATLPVAAKRPIYAGRLEAASPATGLLQRHLKQQAKLIDEALTIA